MKVEVSIWIVRVTINIELRLRKLFRKYLRRGEGLKEATPNPFGF